MRRLLNFCLTLTFKQKMSQHQHLIKSLQAGDKRALSELYDNYSGALYGVIVRICNDETVAQDILQETFLKIWKNANSYDPSKGRFYTWAYRIARNTALNFKRKESHLIQNEDLSVHSNKEQEETNDIDVFKLNGFVQKLDAHHQEAIKLVYFQGLTHREAHEEMNVPLGTFKSYIKQALRNLKENYITVIMAMIIRIMFL